MASIRKRGSSYLLVVSMGYDFEGNRIRPKQKTVHPPEGLTPKQNLKSSYRNVVCFAKVSYLQPWIAFVLPDQKFLFQRG